MKKGLLIFLQIIIVLIALGVLFFILWEPRLEGHNVNATTFEIYFQDKFLAYAYMASVLFFTILYQIFKILEHIKKNKKFSTASVRALQTIKFCASTIILFLIAAEAYLFIVQRHKDDIAGGVFMSNVLILLNIIIITTANISEKSWRKYIKK